MSAIDSFKSKATLTVGDKSYTYYDLKAAEANGLKGEIGRGSCRERV